MAFQPENITKANILDAVKKIEIENIELKPSTKFDVIINGKAYPPKEIIRVAHTISTGNDTGIIYSNEEAVIILRNLGYEIIQKKNLWKLIFARIAIFTKGIELDFMP